MKIIAIVGSPRKKGNTELITQIALKELEKKGFKTELVGLAGKHIQPCDACGACAETGKCRIKDDWDLIFRKMKKADGIILATPVYFGAASPQMTSFISRFYGKGKPLNRKVGGPVVVARRAGQNFTFAQLMFFFMISGMVVPGSTYWNIAFGRTQGEVLKDQEGIKTIKSFAANMAWLIKKIKTPTDE